MVNYRSWQKSRKEFFRQVQSSLRDSRYWTEEIVTHTEIGPHQGYKVSRFVEVGFASKRSSSFSSTPLPVPSIFSLRIWEKYLTCSDLFHSLNLIGVVWQERLMNWIRKKEEQFFLTTLGLRFDKLKTIMIMMAMKKSFEYFHSKETRPTILVTYLIHCWRNMHTTHAENDILLL